jgi:hypothetical protein
MRAFVIAETLLAFVGDISVDYSDGSFNGSEGSVALNFALSITPTQAMTGLNMAIENYLTSSSNKSRLPRGLYASWFLNLIIKKIIKSTAIKRSTFFDHFKQNLFTEFYLF